MTKIQNFSIDIKGIGSALTQTRIAVPAFQRSYSWKSKEVLELLEDIKFSITESRDDYFLGSVVLVAGEDDHVEVIDGQQRLATTTIFLCAIRDHLRKTGDAKNATKLESKYILSEDFGDDAAQPRMKLNQDDSPFFEQHILREADFRKKKHIKKPSHKNLKRAAIECEDFLHTLTADVSDVPSLLVDWVRYIDTNIKVIWIEVGDPSHAYTVFETLNDRGRDLTVSDLLKNLLFSKSGTALPEVQANWSRILNMLESIGAESVLVTFVRHAWATRKGLTRERELYGQIRLHITNKTQALEFSKSLVRDAELYVALLRSDDPFWKRFDNSTARNIETLNTLNMKQNRPLILAVLSHFSDKEIPKAVTLLVSWAVRFIVSDRLGSSDLERSFAENSRAIATEGSIRSTSQLTKAMQKVVPADALFKEEFAQFSTKRPELARYLLRTLETVAGGNASPEWEPNSDSHVINLEHILPKTLSSEWSISAEDHELYVDRLGNMCLLQGVDNSALGNIGFASKKRHYAKSTFTLTSRVAQYAEWPASIEERQHELATLAVRAWPAS